MFMAILGKYVFYARMAEMWPTGPPGVAYFGHPQAGFFCNDFLTASFQVMPSILNSLELRLRAGLALADFGFFAAMRGIVSQAGRMSPCLPLPS